MALTRFRLPALHPRQIGQDASAGLLVALVGIPQCLAYAMLAGLPPMYGLSTAIVAGFVGALLGRSARVNVGPTNTTGLIVLAALIPFAGDAAQLLTAMATLTLLAGAWRLVIVLARAERIFNFIPEAVVLGFATGAALIIAWMQVDDLLGQPLSGIRTALHQTLALATLDWSEVRWSGLALGLLCVALVILGKRLAPRWPTALIVLILATAGSVWGPAGWTADLMRLGEAATVTSGWPVGALPGLDPELWLALIVPALAVALIGSLELIVTLRAHREMPLLSAELRAQGFANVAGAFASAFPASASLTRSALLRLGNAQTRLAPILTSVFLVPVLMFGAQWIQVIPLSVIAGLLVATALTMFDRTAILNLWNGNRQTRWLFLATLIATLVLPFHWAILFGIALSIGLFLLQTSQPQLRWYSVADDGELTLQPPSERDNPAGHWYLQISGSLYFAAAKSLPDQVLQALPTHCRQLYIDLTHAHQLRYSAVLALQEIHSICRERSIELKIGGAGPGFVQLAKRCDAQLPLSEWQLFRRLLSRSDNE